MYLPLGHNKVCNVVYQKLSAKLSASMYLPLGHNKVCNVVYQNKVKCFNVPPLGA